jgi:glycosyltransferase involved in cell wall biosynthesis
LTRVTVYVVCNNHEDFVATAVESVLGQTYGNIEIIVYDNGSVDGSRAILRQLQAQHGFKLVEQDNIGLVRTIENAYASASGEYVMRLDADDWLTPDAVEKLVAPLEQSPAIALTFPDYFEVAADGHVLRRIRRRVFDDAVTLLDQPAHGAVTLTRKSAYLEVGGIDQNITAQDGFDIWLKITAKYRVQNLSEPLFYYRRHEGNLTGDSIRILRQRHDIYRNHAADIDPEHYLGVVVLPKMKNNPELFLTRLFGDKSLLARSLGKIEQSGHCRKAVVICSERDEEAARHHALASSLSCSVVTTAPNENGFQKVKSVASSHESVKNLIFVSPQNPFMHFNYIDTMIYYQDIFKVGSVHSCVIDNHLLFQHSGRSLTVFNDGFERSEREAIIRKSGGLMLVDALQFSRLGHGLAEPIGHIEIDEITAMEIGSPISIKAAEALAAVWK